MMVPRGARRHGDDLGVDLRVVGRLEPAMRCVPSTGSPGDGERCRDDDDAFAAASGGDAAHLFFFGG